jgi:hypothetical protein
VLTKLKETYKSKEISFEIPDDDSHIGEIHLEINGEHVHVTKMEDGRYATHLLPYADYSSVLELAKDLIDKVPQFRGDLIK